MARIGISVNGVLRDYFGKIEKVHDKYFPPDEEGNGIFIEDYDLEKWIKFPQEETVKAEIEFNPDFNEKEFLISEKESQSVKEFVEEITVDDFIYDKCCLEIFGYADEIIDGAVNFINDLSLKYREHEFIIISRETGRSIPATLFFLAKTSCMIPDIKFIMANSDHWNYVDVMVTDHPDILNSKPKGKISIKVNKTFNQDIDSDHTIQSVKELEHLDLLTQVNN